MNELVLVASSPSHVEDSGISLGMLSLIDPVAGGVEALTLPVKPQVIEVHPQRPFAYVASWDEGAAITTVALPAAEGSVLRVVARRGSGGTLPCSLAVDMSGGYLVVAHYDAGGIVAFPILEDGSLGDPGPALELAGSGPVAERQDRSHPHCVVVDPADGTLIVSDLGSDRLVRLSLDLSTGALVVRSVGISAPGSGPRHLALLTAGIALVTDELSSTVSWHTARTAGGAYEWSGSLAATLSRKLSPNFPSDIVTTPNGAYAYVANRGAHTIAVFAVESGQARRIGEYGAGGDWPASLSIASGRLFCALRDSGVVRSWRIDENSGALSDPRDVLVPYPTWVTAFQAYPVARSREVRFALCSGAQP